MDVSHNGYRCEIVLRILNSLVGSERSFMDDMSEEVEREFCQLLKWYSIHKLIAPLLALQGICVSASSHAQIALLSLRIWKSRSSLVWRLY